MRQHPPGLIGRLVRTLRLYLTLMGAAVRGRAQYRANLILLTLGGLAYQLAGFVFIGLILTRFGEIGGWTLPEVALLYALRLCAHGLWLCVLNQLMQIDRVVREGEFDRYLVRPLNPLVQLLSRNVSMSTLGDLVGGVTLLAVATTQVDLNWSPQSIGYMVLAIVGGAMAEASIHLALAALAFRLLSLDGARYLAENLLTNFGSYPLKIFPAVARFSLTFIVPVAFIAYIPSAVLLDRSGELGVSAEIGYLAPLVGVLLICSAYRFFRYQMRFYSSSGH